jgi:hypothetical protein
VVRDRGIYKLPDGNDYIAMSVGSGEYALYLRENVLGLPPRYILKADGRIVPVFGQEYEVWAVGQMKDTGDTHNFVRTGPA